MFMETLEVDRFLRIMGRGAKRYRYVDDILAIVPECTNVDNKLRMLNSLNKHVQFTVEVEKDNKNLLPDYCDLASGHMCKILSVP